MNLHDLVLVKTQPDNQYVQLQGKFAVVTEVDPTCDTHVGIDQLELTGYTTGSGSVPVECLEVVNKTAPAAWRAAYAVWKVGAAIRGMEDQNKLTAEQSHKILELVAGKYNLDLKLLTSILNDLHELEVIDYDYYERPVEVKPKED